MHQQHTFNSLITFLQSHEFFSALDAAVMPFIIVRVRMDSYVHCSLALEQVATQSSTVVWNQDSVYYGCSVFSARSNALLLNRSLLPFTFSCSHSTSPFLCQTLGMLHEQIFSIFYVSSQLLAAVFVCVLYTFCICLNVCFKYFVFRTCL